MEDPINKLTLLHKYHKVITNNENAYLYSLSRSPSHKISLQLLSFGITFTLRERQMAEKIT